MESYYRLGENNNCRASFSAWSLSVIPLLHPWSDSSHDFHLIFGDDGGIGIDGCVGRIRMSSVPMI